MEPGESSRFPPLSSEVQADSLTSNAEHGLLLGMETLQWQLYSFGSFAALVYRLMAATHLLACFAKAW